MIRNKQSPLAFIPIYALVLIIGGAFGHQSQSLVAITSSIVSGVIVFIGWWVILHDKKYALPLTLIFVCGLTLFFIYRWFLIKKFYPPGFLMLISLSLAFQIGQAIIERRCKGFLNLKENKR